MPETIKGRWWNIEVETDVKHIKASYNTYKEWKQDPLGYFLIKVDRDKKEISAAFCTNDHKMRVVIVGKNAEEIYNTIVREELISSFQHAANLGEELSKAETALKLGILYVQDSPLDFSKVKK